MARQLVEGESVQARYYTKNKAIWKYGTITKKLGNLHHIMTLHDGFVYKRHINQLHSTRVPNPVADVTHDQHSASVNEQHNDNEPNVGDLVKITNNTIDTNTQ